MRAMRTLLGLAVLLFAGWSAWWWYGSTHQKQAVEDWLEDRRDAGWQAETQDLTVTGYPNRFDMIAEGLTLADPASGWAWTAPEFRTFMLSYQPNRVIAAWPGIHRFSVPGEQVELTAETLRASAAFAPDPGLAPTTSLDLERKHKTNDLVVLGSLSYGGSLCLPTAVPRDLRLRKPRCARPAVSSKPGGRHSHGPVQSLVCVANVVNSQPVPLRHT